MTKLEEFLDKYRYLPKGSAQYDFLEGARAFVKEVWIRVEQISNCDPEAVGEAFKLVAEELGVDE